MFKSVKQIKLNQNRIQGLSMINDGMEVQIDHFKARSQWLENDGKEADAKICEAQLRVLLYWKAEVEKALEGELHY